MFLTNIGGEILSNKMQEVRARKAMEKRRNYERTLSDKEIKEINEMLQFTKEKEEANNE